MTDESSKLLVGQGNDAPPPARSAYSGGTLSPFDERMHRWLIGPEGLRPGWRLLLYAAMARALYLLLGVFTNYAVRFGVHGLWLEMFAAAGLVPVAMAPAFVLASLEGRSFDSYGLTRRLLFGKLFWAGLFWGFAAITLLMLGLRGAGAFYFGPLALHGVRILKFAAFWGVFFLLVALYEEFLSRGYVQFTLAKMLGFWPSAVLLSLGFGAFHLGNPGETRAGILGAVLIGFFFCLTLRRTGKPLVRHWISRRLGLGRKLLVLGPRQRRDFSRPLTEILLPRFAMAHRRHRRPRRQHAGVRANCVAVDSV